MNIKQTIGESIYKEYNEVNRDISKEILEEVVGMGAEKLAEEIIHDPDSSLGRAVDDFLNTLE